MQAGFGSVHPFRPGRGGGAGGVPLHPALAYVIQVVGMDAAEKMAAEGSVKQCKCKNSSCLKLYCDCFAHGVYCVGCSCLNCLNTVEHYAEVFLSFFLLFFFLFFFFFFFFFSFFFFFLSFFLSFFFFFFFTHLL